MEEIAIRYQVSLEKIIESNGMLDPDTIYAGTELFIPDAKINESFRKRLIPPPYKPKFVKPTSGRLTSGFGYRIHPILKKRRMHKGIDIVARYGSNVKAATGGIITYSGQMGSYGNLVVIDHQNGFETRYAHNARLKVKKGEKVRQGQTIALVGNTGRSNGTHLHFEIWKNNKVIDPNTLYGSWAGAFGNFQFMPSTIKNYAVDFDNDEKISLKKTEDSFASAANYLNKLGWKNSNPCFYKVTLKSNIPDQYLNISAKKIHSTKKVNYLKKYIQDSNYLENFNNLNAAIITPDAEIVENPDKLSPAYIIFDNYKLKFIMNM